MRTAAKKARPRATPLSRPRILRAALAIADTAGLEGLTVRRLAQELGVTAMAIYRHYESKDAIERSLVDLVVGDYDVTSHDDADWREWICTTYALMRRGLCEHPAIIPLLSKATYAGSDAMAVLERVLQTLRDAGLSPRAAAHLFHALMAYTIGSITLRSLESLRAGARGRREASRQLQKRRLEFARGPRSRYPRVVAAASHLASHFEGRHFEAGLRAIIGGVLAAPPVRSGRCAAESRISLPRSAASMPVSAPVACVPGRDRSD